MFCKILSSKNNIKYLRNKDFYQKYKNNNMEFSIISIDDQITKTANELLNIVMQFNLL